MTEDAANSARLYVTDEDIARLPCTANDTVFAVKAPQGTTLEVPDPDDGLETGQRRYRWSLHLSTARCDNATKSCIPRFLWQCSVLHTAPAPKCVASSLSMQSLLHVSEVSLTTKMLTHSWQCKCTRQLVF